MQKLSPLVLAASASLTAGGDLKAGATVPENVPSITTQVATNSANILSTFGTQPTLMQMIEEEFKARDAELLAQGITVNPNGLYLVFPDENEKLTSSIEIELKEKAPKQNYEFTIMPDYANEYSYQDMVRDKENAEKRKLIIPNVATYVGIPCALVLLLGIMYESYKNLISSPELKVLILKLKLKYASIISFGSSSNNNCIATITETR